MKTKVRKPQVRHQRLLQIAPEQIVRLEGNLNYTSFVLFSGKREIMSYTLGIYSKILPKEFIRVNRSCIVNMKFIKRVDLESKKLLMTDKTELQISRRRWNTIMQNFED